MSSILIVTDAWHPQINGVVRSLERTADELVDMGVRVEFLTPQAFRTLPCPTYPEIRLSLTHRGIVRRMMREFDCEHLHIATEGPLGILAASVAKKANEPFTTSYHTRFPEYVSARLPVPLSWSYTWLRRFHNAGSGCMVATRSLDKDLRARGFKNLMRWSRGVDEQLFKPYEGSVLPDDLPRPLFLYVGRVSVEKNITAFLDLKLPGTKVVVGGGPQLEALRREYPDTHFTGAKLGEDLARHYSDGDVFVFPFAHGHVRQRFAGGAGLRGSGRRLSRHGAARRDRRYRGRCAVGEPSGSGRSGPGHPEGSLPANCPELHLGRQRKAVPGQLHRRA